MSMPYLEFKYYVTVEIFVIPLGKSIYFKGISTSGSLTQLQGVKVCPWTLFPIFPLLADIPSVKLFQDRWFSLEAFSWWMPKQLKFKLLKTWFIFKLNLKWRQISFKMSFVSHKSFRWFTFNCITARLFYIFRHSCFIFCQFLNFLFKFYKFLIYNL